MKSAIMLCVALAATAFSGVQSQAKTSLPDACGSDKSKFDVKTALNEAAPPPPDAGSAQIVFIETVDNFIAECLSCNVTTRIGMDGAWVGADKGNSYFVYSTSPGEHHLCANWQSSFGSLSKVVGLDSFTADPGKTYYFQAKVKIKTTVLQPDDTIELTPLNADEGKYLVKSYMLSTPMRK